MHDANSRKYRGKFEAHSPKTQIMIGLGKGLFSTSRTFESPKLDGASCQEEEASLVGIAHPLKNE